MDTNDAQQQQRATGHASASHAATTRAVSNTTVDDRHSSDFYHRLAMSRFSKCEKKIPPVKGEPGRRGCWDCGSPMRAETKVWPQVAKATPFWATVCKTVRPMLSDRCLSVLSVCNVGVLWPNGWMDQDETWHAGRPRRWPHCVRWGPSSPSPKGAQPPSNFRLGPVDQPLHACHQRS